MNSWGMGVLSTWQGEAQAGPWVAVAGISVPALTAAGSVAFAAIVLLHPALSCPCPSQCLRGQE